MVFQRRIFESGGGRACHRSGKSGRAAGLLGFPRERKVRGIQEDETMRILSAILVTVMLAGAVSGCVVYGRPYHPWHPCYRCY
jgi:hypothetical protein